MAVAPQRFGASGARAPAASRSFRGGPTLMGRGSVRPLLATTSTGTAAAGTSPRPPRRVPEAM
eukprot:136855-Pyramimonas_sp.AAC.1